MTAAPFEQLTADARRYTEPAAAALDVIRDQLDMDLHPVDDLPPAGRASAGFVDGAVISSQSDAISWIAAVACGEHPCGPTVRVTAEQVLPVTGEVEQVRSLLMGLCELQVAAALDCPLVCVDGGLVTSLLSLTYHATLHDPATAEAARRRLIDPGAVEAVTGYVDAVAAGRIVALPKQDTAHGFLDRWRRGITVDDATAAVLRGMRDRPTVQRLMPPGTMLTPRPATEARRISTDTVAGTGWLSGQMARIEHDPGLYVTYVKPARGAQRVIKVEYRETDTAEFSDGRRIAAEVAAACTTVRVLEPVGQHLVDRECKRAVQAHFARVEHAVAAAVPRDASRYYRT